MKDWLLPGDLDPRLAVGLSEEMVGEWERIYDFVRLTLSRGGARVSVRIEYGNKFRRK